MKQNCTEKLQCSVCKSSDHPSALHVYREQSSQAKIDSHNDSKYSQRSVENQGGESQRKVTSSCTQVCGDKESTSKSCAKTLPLYVYPKGKPEIAQKVYALIDDQSTHTLATPILFDRLGGKCGTNKICFVVMLGKDFNDW